MSGHQGGCNSGCNHEDHDHSSDGEMGIQYSLYQKIDLANVVCFNETTDGSGKTVFKPWDERLDRSRFVESDADPELLFNIPFTGNVKIKALIIIGGEGMTHPKRLRLFKNKTQMSFDDTSGEADQEFELNRDEQGVLEYQLKATKFSSVFHLSLHFPQNFGHHDGDESSTKIYYIGLKGDFVSEKNDGVVLATYESRPMLEDHKGEIPEMGRHQVS